MVLILLLYVGLVWLVFAKLKLVRWGWLSGIVTVSIGVAILSVFVALFNHLTPSGRIAVFGRVVDVTPNVSGQVIAIPVETNVLVKAGTVLFQIDPEPYRLKVRQLAAALAGAQQKVGQLKAGVDVAIADVQASRAQWERADQRREDLEQLGQRQVTSQFNVQDSIAQANALVAQLEAAKSRFRKSRSACQTAHEQDDGSGVEESAG
jgi:multidrug resistance efflux pump